jgi:hypothetical protein
MTEIVNIDPKKQQKLVKLANARVPRAVRAIYAVAQLTKYQPINE